MKRNGAIGVALAAVALTCGFLVYWRLQDTASADTEYSAWLPDPTAIQRKIGSADTPTPGMKDEERRQWFMDLFKQRFRNHIPAVAVGLRFLTPTHIKLMCPARMEPFYIDRIALAAWREAKEDFGKPIDVDIYETFIGTNQIKIGELRALPGLPKIAHINYDYSTAMVMNGPRIPWPRNKPRFQVPQQNSSTYMMRMFGRRPMR